jgi:hypothetical protein
MREQTIKIPNFSKLKKVKKKYPYRYNRYRTVSGWEIDEMFICKTDGGGYTIMKKDFQDLSNESYYINSFESFNTPRDAYIAAKLFKQYA